MYSAHVLLDNSQITLFDNINSNHLYKQCLHSETLWDFSAQLRNFSATDKQKKSHSKTQT